MKIERGKERKCTESLSIQIRDVVEICKIKRVRLQLPSLLPVLRFVWREWDEYSIQIQFVSVYSIRENILSMGVQCFLQQSAPTKRIQNVDGHQSDEWCVARKGFAFSRIQCIRSELWFFFRFEERFLCFQNV